MTKAEKETSSEVQAEKLSDEVEVQEQEVTEKKESTSAVAPAPAPAVAPVATAPTRVRPGSFADLLGM